MYLNIVLHWALNSDTFFYLDRIETRPEISSTAQLTTSINDLTSVLTQNLNVSYNELASFEPSACDVFYNIK